MVSMKDIARELNLSRCTVSNILNNKLDQYSYRKETIELVRNKAEEMGYVVNNLAQSLKTGTAHMIALVIPDISSTFYIEIIRKIERLAYESNYGLIVCVTEERVDKEKRILEMLKSRRVDGVIIACVSYTDSVIDESAYKVVAFDRIVKNAQFPTVTVDDMKVSYDLTTRILEKGFVSPLFVGTSEQDYTVQCRLEGFQKALKDHGLVFIQDNVFYDWYNEMDAYEWISRIRRDGRIRFDSIVSTTNEILFGVMKAMGDDFRNIGYGGFYSFNGSSFMGEKIINVIPPPDMAELSFRMLLNRIQGKTVENKVLEAKIM
ncbi:LacI family DNA-binding transcriptional regulator [Diplocloster hominis]|uniref:LacI family DNA-binding transcriptional regulator n=1 Tax=Diplocloster hominis TaxID=3079010 RepID=UPI0031BB3FC8